MIAYQYAGFWRRFGAAVVDGACVFLVTGVAHIFALAVASLPQALAANGIDVEVDLSTQIAVAGVTMVAWVKFFGTPGKLLFDCYVVDADSGQRVTWRQAALRYLGYLLALLPMGLGFLWIAVDKQKRGWHDRVARTLVITQPWRHFDDESTKALALLIREVQ
ncbi:MAG: RDD family protein [Pseudomonadota bacterium]